MTRVCVLFFLPVRQRPCLLDDQGKVLFGDGYQFQPGKDEVIREGKDGYIVSYGEMTYRCLDAVLQLQQQG